MDITEDEILHMLRQIELMRITLVPQQDPHIKIKGDILYHASNGWSIEVCNWSGEFGGIVEVIAPDGSIFDTDYLEAHMPKVEAYFPSKVVAWRAYGMKPIECGFLYRAKNKLGPFRDAKPDDVISHPDREPPWIVVYPEVIDVGVAHWPGRLWLVQILDKIEPQDHRGNYVQCVSVQIIREMDTSLLFGQKTEGRAVEGVLSLAGALTQKQAKILTEARHPKAKALQSAGYHRWLASNGEKPLTRDRDMSGVVAAGHGRSRSPIGHGLSLIHRGVWEAAERIAGETAFEEDEEERWLIEPWAGAASALMDAGWALGGPKLFSKTELEILLQAYSSLTKAI